MVLPVRAQVVAALLVPAPVVLPAQPLQALVLLAKDVVVRAQLLLPAQPQAPVQPQLLVPPPQEAAVAQEAVHLLLRSFSAAMAGILPPPGPPMYTPAPRSRWKPKRRPCPLT